MTPGLHLEQTENACAADPAMRALRLVDRLFASDRALAAKVCLAAMPLGPSRIWVSMLHSRERGMGFGSTALDALCCACDIEDVTIDLVATSIAGSLREKEGCLDQAMLEAFYARRRFIPVGTGRHNAMTRPPSTPGRMRTSTPPRNEAAGQDPFRSGWRIS